MKAREVVLRETQSATFREETPPNDLLSVTAIEGLHIVTPVQAQTDWR